MRTLYYYLLSNLNQATERLPNFLGTLINDNGFVSLFRCKRMNRLPLVNSRSSQRMELRACSDVFFSSSISAKTACGKIQIN